MLGVLLESRVRRHRRSGGMALSVATHIALIGAVTAATTVPPKAPKPLEPRIFRLAPPPPQTPPTPRRVVTSGAPRHSPNPVFAIDIKRIDAPTTVPVELPPIDLTRGFASDSIVVRSGPRGNVNGCRLGCLQEDAPSSSSEWRGNEALMHLVTTAKPRYPELLRQAGIDGRVLVRFTVDTLGRVDPSTVQILQSTHAQFTRAVRDVLAAFRFRPAESGGRRIPVLAEMPFEFALKR